MRFLFLLLCFSLIAFKNYAQLYWNGTGSWTAANAWSTVSGGPYNQTWATNSAIFDVPSSTITGATITCSGITAVEDVTVTPTGTFGTGGTIITINVANGKTFDFGSQAISTAAGTGFIKSNTGVLAIAGSTYNGGFTMNAGTLVIRGINAVGSGAAFTINGGTICSNANRNLTGKPSSIVIGGDFTIGATTGLASSTATLTFDAPISLGTSVTRTITIGNTATHTLNGAISGTGSGITVNTTSTGKITLGAASTYNGLTTVSGGTLQLNNAAGNTLPATNDVTINSGGVLQVSTNQTLYNLTLNTGGVLMIDNGVTLTINGTFNHNGGSIVPVGTGAIVYGSNSTLSYGASTAQTTTNTEFPAVSGPTHLTINNSSGVTLHATRSVSTGNLTLSAGNLIIGNNDITAFSTVGGTSTSHVYTNGTGKLILTAIGSLAKVFPIGSTATSITPLAIYNGVNIDYGARVETGFTYPIYNGTNAVNRTWFVQAASTPGATVNVNFFYSAGDGNGGFNYTATVDHGVYTTGWNINQTGLVQAGSYQVATLVPSFLGGTELPMVIGNLGSILKTAASVDLSVQKLNSKAQLNWVLNNIASAKEITVERSANGRTFTTLATMPALINNYTDDQLLPGTNYYRIKMTDANGKIAYSAIAAIINSDAGFDIVNLLPNIVSADMQLNIAAAKKTKLNIAITDMAGHTVTTLNYNLAAGSNLFDINVAKLASGMYYLTAVTAEGEIKTVKFVKQ